MERIISTGTLNPNHLVPIFKSLLKELDGRKYHELEVNGMFLVHDEHDLVDVLDLLQIEIENNIPDGYSFGCSEGNSSLIGIWGNQQGDTNE